tara:strand:- start:3878 stop:4489 length:612 start_codon:yes stop_codon:yes gene_type:complete
MKNYTIKQISKSESKNLLDKYHYLTNESKGFRSGHNYGLYKNKEIVGVCIFHGVSVPETLKGCLNLNREDQEGFFELGRLCLKPNLNEKNILSWFVSHSIRHLKKIVTLKGVLSYADSRYHNGYIYQACNFKYYGLSSPKKDFWFDLGDGKFKKHSRGKVKGLKGEWRERPRKHRYFILFDNNLKMLWNECPYPKLENKNPLN